MKNNREYLEVPIQIEDEQNIPAYRSEKASGADIRAHLKENLILPSGQSVLVPTGLRVAIPEGYEMQIRPRSGLARDYQITVINSPGTIDADYRGEIKIILINHGQDNFLITPGMRIAQLVLAPVVQAKFFSVNTLIGTLRGSGGFGHTGLH
ncbi:MAG: dUTP diphosphatase [Waddliaceae bacterium]